ncbi:MAG: DNA translocase FtsK [Bacteroidetes bacterium]|nr:DNA translocase FtsK [Bacteroidota bacterium]
MTNRIKSNNSNKGKEAEKDPSLRDFRKEPEAQFDLAALLKDERTWKIVGVGSIILSLFLFISFASYLFTWQEDQAIAQQGLSALLDEDKQALNWLGRLGAVVAHFFFFKAFGLASFIVCTFFFVVGVNLLFRQRVFSIWRNLKYVTIGVSVMSVSLSYVFRSSSFPFGGGVGELIKVEMEGLFGVVGTGAVLFLTAFAYIIWQFNPNFNWPVKKLKPIENEEELTNEEEVANEKEVTNEEQTQFLPLSAGQTLNELYAAGVRPNQLKEDTGMLIPPAEEEASIPLSLVELDEPIAVEELPDHVAIPPAISTPDSDISAETITTMEQSQEETLSEPEVLPSNGEGDLELEIKTAQDSSAEAAETVPENLPPYEPTLDLSKYKYPTLQLLEQHGSEKIVHDPSELESNKTQIINTLRNYAIEIQKISATVGPTVTLYEIVPAPGVRISRIKNLEDDIALSLAALGIRIIAPIPGKGTIGIEVPNLKKTIVSMRTLLSSEKFQHNNYSLPIAIGKKIDNENYIVDLASMPHLLMAGATGQGKSVGLNAILVSLLYKKHPSQLKFVLIDPKKVELSIYRHIERHFLAKLPGEEDAIITDTKKVIHTLNALCIEMDNRYDLLKEAGARNIKEYNEKFINRKLNPQKGHAYLPFIVLVVDEFADLIMTAGREVEMPIARLAQLARAIGIHLIIATQRPSVNIITGTIKANFPSRIAFKVSSKIDSRTILDTGGSEQLIGKGDMLISHHGELTRLQCAFVDTLEVEKVVDYIKEQQGYPQAFLLPEYIDEKEAEARGELDMSNRDSLFEDAARLIVQNQIGSTSLLQRRMKLGYNRAGRLMDQLEIAGIVGPSQGSKPRDVLIRTEADLMRHLENMG